MSFSTERVIFLKLRASSMCTKVRNSNTGPWETGPWKIKISLQNKNLPPWSYPDAAAGAAAATSAASAVLICI